MRGDGRLSRHRHPSSRAPKAKHGSRLTFQTSSSPQGPLLCGRRRTLPCGSFLSVVRLLSTPQGSGIVNRSLSRADMFASGLPCLDEFVGTAHGFHMSCLMVFSSHPIISDELETGSSRSGSKIGSDNCPVGCVMTRRKGRHKTGRWCVSAISFVTCHFCVPYRFRCRAGPCVIGQGFGWCRRRGGARARFEMWAAHFTQQLSHRVSLEVNCAHPS